MDASGSVETAGQADYYSDRDDCTQLLSAEDMARETFLGEQEFRAKVNVEIQHNIHVEVLHVFSLFRSTGKEDGSSYYQYQHPAWSDWLKQGPEMVAKTDSSLIKRKTCMREYLILSAIANKLKLQGYTCAITKPYHGTESDKDYLFIQWSHPKPVLGRGILRSTLQFIKVIISLGVISCVAISLVSLAVFSTWFVLTRSEEWM